MTYNNVSIEICGRCNAKCKYCFTGRVNRGLLSSANGSLMSPEVFSNVISFLKNNGIICHDTHFCLYNYGEPFLHPQLREILSIIDSYGYTFELSTNGSIPLNNEIIPYMRNMTKLKFSMCGFSQVSYDKISQLSFDNVKLNIIQMLEILRAEKWNGTPVLKFHVYENNINEVEHAREFAEIYGMVFVPIHAIIGDLKMQVGWFDACEEKYFIDEVNHDLLSAKMFRVYAEKMPNQWRCRLSNELIIDENLNVLNCCMATKNEPKDYLNLGKLYDFSSHDNQRCTSELGTRCLKSGVGYAINNFPTYRCERWLGLVEKILRDEKVDVIGNGALYKSFQNVYSSKDIKWSHYCDIKDYISSSSHNQGIIIADTQFYNIKNELLSWGVPKYMIRAIYNINIR